MNNQVVFFDDTARSWERALYAFLAERRAMSRGYRRSEIG